MNRMWLVAQSMVPALGFVFIYNMTPSTNEVFPGYIFDTFEFANWQLQFNSCLSLMGAALGSYVFLRFFTTSRNVFIIGTVASVLAGVTQCMVAADFLTTLGLDYRWFIPLDGSTTSMFDRIALMPTLVLAGQNCPRGMEGTMFALFSSVSSLAGLASAGISAQIVNYFDISTKDWSKLWYMIVICRLSQLIPLLALPLLSLSRVKKRALDRRYPDGQSVTPDSIGEPPGHSARYLILEDDQI